MIFAFKSLVASYAFDLAYKKFLPKLQHAQESFFLMHAQADPEKFLALSQLLVHCAIEQQKNAKKLKDLVLLRTSKTLQMVNETLEQLQKDQQAQSTQSAQRSIEHNKQKLLEGKEKLHENIALYDRTANTEQMHLRFQSALMHLMYEHAKEHPNVPFELAPHLLNNQSVEAQMIVQIATKITQEAPAELKTYLAVCNQLAKRSSSAALPLLEQRIQVASPTVLLAFKILAMQHAPESEAFLEIQEQSKSYCLNLQRAMRYGTNGNGVMGPKALSLLTNIHNAQMAHLQQDKQSASYYLQQAHPDLTVTMHAVEHKAFYALAPSGFLPMAQSLHQVSVHLRGEPNGSAAAPRAAQP